MGLWSRFTLFRPEWKTSFRELQQKPVAAQETSENADCASSELGSEQRTKADKEGKGPDRKSVGRASSRTCSPVLEPVRL